MLSVTGDILSVSASFEKLWLEERLLDGCTSLCTRCVSYAA